MEVFDKKIRKDIDKWSYYVWFILRDENVICPCVDFTSKQAQPSCKKCFGTGRKVRLRRVKAAHQNNDISARGEGMGTGEKNVVGVYYTNYNYAAHEEDLILDGDTLDKIHHIYPMRSNHSEPVYYQYETAPKKNNAEVIKKNLKEFIRKAGYNV